MNLIDQYDIPPEIMEDIKKIAHRDVHLLMEDILALAFTRSKKLISIQEE